MVTVLSTRVTVVIIAILSFIMGHIPDEIIDLRKAVES
jgi:hypothetical protein